MGTYWSYCKPDDQQWRIHDFQQNPIWNIDEHPKCNGTTFWRPLGYWSFVHSVWGSYRSQGFPFNIVPVFCHIFCSKIMKPSWWVWTITGWWLVWTPLKNMTSSMTGWWDSQSSWENRIHGNHSPPTDKAFPQPEKKSAQPRIDGEIHWPPGCCFWNNLRRSSWI